MPARYILFDINSAYTKVWTRHLGDYPWEVRNASITDVQADIYVSPANGHGQLDGGIDKLFPKMFPGIQGIVNTELSIYKSRKPPLGVGSCLLVSIPQRKSKLLLAPTMDLPSKLKHPWNAFWSCLCVFYLTKDLDVTVAIPGMGTGTGHIEPDDMLKMMQWAWRVATTRPIEEVYGAICPNGIDYVPGRQLILPFSLNERAVPNGQFV